MDERFEYSGGGQTFTEDNSQGGLTRITADRNIFERQFWEMFLQPPLADLTLTFEDGDLTVNRAVLAALSGSVCDLMTCQHDCLLLSHTSKLTFLSLVETLSQQGEEREEPLPADVAEIVNTLNISVLAGRQSLQHRSHLKTERQNNNEKLPLIPEDTSNNVIKAEISPRQRSRQSTKDDDFIDDEEEDEPWSDDTEQTTERAEDVSRPAGRPRGSKNGSGRGKTCEDCGGKVLDAWKHRRQCIAINTDIKYVCHGCKKGFRRFGAIKKHFQSTKKCKSNSKNQAEYCDVMKYMEREVKGRTICYDCGCYYLTKKGIHEHRKNCSAFTQFKCFKCSRGINSMDGFHIHFSKFPECRDAPENVEILAEIVAKSHKPEFHVCYLCGAKYKAKESIEKHMMTHAEHLDYFLCSQPDCDKKFMTRKALNLHLKNHSMPKTICSICGKQIKAGSMALHMVLHTGKKIECDICGKLFQHKGVLNKHMKNAHDPKKVPKVVKEKKRRVKKEVLEVESGAVTQLPPVQSIQVQLDNEGEAVQAVSLPSVVPGLALTVPDINTVNMTANNSHQSYQNILLPTLTTTNIQTYLSNTSWSK